MRIGLAATLALLAIAAPASAEEPRIAERFKESERDRFLAVKGFKVDRTVASIPADVAAGTAALYGMASLRMADPGQQYQATDVVIDRSLPSRRLVFCAASEEFAALHYKKGGIATRHVVLVFARREGRADLVWGGTLFTELPDLPALKDAVRSGTVRTQSLELNW